MSNLSRKLIDSLTEEEKLKLSNWAQEAGAISTDTSLPKKAKIIKLYRVTAKEEVVKSFLRRTLKLTKRHLWDDRTWAGRLATSGLVLGLGVFGTEMAGIASAGIGVGVPVYLLTSAGGAFLGTLLEELKKSNKS